MPFTASRPAASRNAVNVLKKDPRVMARKLLCRRGMYPCIELAGFAACADEGW
jgi:hypothetical protein